MWEWWEKYFHREIPRPEKVSDNAIDSMYLNRKRYLYKEFGEFSIGEEVPIMDGAYVNMITKYGMDVIPYLFGAEMECQEAGGWMPKLFSIETLKKLEPVDISNHPFSEYLLKEKEKKLQRYGSVNIFLDYESATNLAVRLRGEEFYMDLIDDEVFARHLLDVNNKSIYYLLKFILANFPLSCYHGVNDFQLGNCNVTMVSPSMYSEIIKPFDVEFAGYFERLTGQKGKLHLHHCDVELDKFIDAYKDIPNLERIQASHRSDIALISEKMPGVSFCGIFSPIEMMNQSTDELEKSIERAIRLGCGEIDLWNIDPAISPEKLRGIFGIISKYSKEYDVNAEFKVIPFCWDELEWAFPKYQKGLS